jgi:hypothetical protein
MSPPSVWGPPIWTFFHVIASKANPERFQAFLRTWHPLMIKICGLLPCPECSMHATNFLQRVQLKDIPNKQAYENTLCFFHNSVNKRKMKPVVPISILDKYKTMDLKTVFKNFMKQYNVKGNMSQINESFRRNFIIKDIFAWMKMAADHKLLV